MAGGTAGARVGGLRPGNDPPRGVTSTGLKPHAPATTLQSLYPRAPSHQGRSPIAPGRVRDSWGDCPRARAPVAPKRTPHTTKAAGAPGALARGSGATRLKCRAPTAMRDEGRVTQIRTKGRHVRCALAGQRKGASPDVNPRAMVNSPRNTCRPQQSRKRPSTASCKSADASHGARTPLRTCEVGFLCSFSGLRRALRTTGLPAG
jgi:hypothetical protein